MHRAVVILLHSKCQFLSCCQWLLRGGISLDSLVGSGLNLVLLVIDLLVLTTHLAADTTLHALKLLQLERLSLFLRRHPGPDFLFLGLHILDIESAKVLAVLVGCIPLKDF